MIFTTASAQHAAPPAAMLFQSDGDIPDASTTGQRYPTISVYCTDDDLSIPEFNVAVRKLRSRLMDRTGETHYHVVPHRGVKQRQLCPVSDCILNVGHPVAYHISGSGFPIGIAFHPRPDLEDAIRSLKDERDLALAEKNAAIAERDAAVKALSSADTLRYPPGYLKGSARGRSEAVDAWLKTVADGERVCGQEFSEIRELAIALVDTRAMLAELSKP